MSTDLAQADFYIGTLYQRAMYRVRKKRPIVR